MGKRGLRVAITVLLMGISNTGRAQDAPRTVRGDGAAPGNLIGRGLVRSATFLDLVTSLERGDVVVYVQFARCTGGVPACLLWAARAGGVRRLLVRLDPFDRSENDLTALLAHELQHASEVAANPEVVDEVSFRRLFATQGWKSSGGFETAEARDITRRVLSELIR